MDLTEYRVIFYGFFFGKPAVRKKKFWIDGLKKISPKTKWICFENCPGATRMVSGKLDNVQYFPAMFYATKFQLGGFLAGCKLVKQGRRLEPELFESVFEQERVALESRLSGLQRRLMIYYRLKSVSGVGQLNRLLKENAVGEKDVFILWGQHMSGHRLLANWAKKAGAKVFFTEGAELQGSVFVSESGILNFSWTRVQSKKFLDMPISDESLERAKNYISVLRSERFSNKSYDGEDSRLQSFVEGNKKVIYVNGLENFASGLNPRCSEVSKAISPKFKSNRELLLRVLELAEKHDWVVVYKDHPNTFDSDKRLLVSGISNPRLIILNNIDIHTVMDHADAMVSFCSKVVMLSLSRDVPVVLAGAFSVVTDCLDYGFEEDPNLEDGLLKVLGAASGKEVDQLGLQKLTARFIEHYAYRLPEAPWESERDDQAAWSDIQSFLKDERRVVSTPLV